MVNSAARKLEKELIEIVEVPKDDINWSSVSLSDVLNKGKRLEASRFNIEKNRYEEILKRNKYPLITLLNEKYVDDCYNGTRTKREYISPNNKNAVMFLGGSEILDVYPKTEKYLDYTNSKYESYKVKKNDILLTCSGTLGKISLVTDRIKNSLISQHVIKIRLKELQGYLYAFLKTDLAQCLIKSNKYGSLVSHIEPEHLNEILIPDAPYSIKKKIHDLVIQSYSNRDESNKLIDEATKIMIEELDLPSIEELNKEAFSYSQDINSFSTKLSGLDGRLEGSYHIPLIDVIEKHMSKHANLRYLDDKALVKDIILPGRFTRIYVTKEHGVPFIGGKDLFQLKSATGKYLSKKSHKNRLEKELLIKENSIILPSRGTLGSVMMAMPHQIGKYAISDNLIQMECEKDYIGYIYIFLNSIYGEKLIYRQKYGGVVNAIEPIQLKKVSVPFLKDVQKIELINNLAFKANELRYQAYKQEQEAINIMNKEVLGL